MTIGYGFEQPIVSNVQPFLYNTDLIAKVAFNKQQQYDTAFQGLQNLKKQALDISFINKKEQGKIDSFNDEIAKVFNSKNGEFGDLSKGSVVEQYTKLFEKIGNDPSLIQRYKKDREIVSKMQRVEEKRSAKDPAKAGYSNINYQNYLARVKEYSDLDLDKSENKDYQVKPYTDYVDYNKEISDRIKREVPIEKFSQDRNVNGYIVTDTWVGRDPNKVRRLVEDYMRGEAGTQLREEAEYMWRNYKDNPQAWGAVYNDHMTYTQNQKRIIDSQLDEQRAKLKNRNLSTEERNQIAGDVAALERKSGELEVSLKSPDDYFRRDKDTVIGDIANVYTYDKISAISNSSGGYAKSTTMKPDQTFLTFQRMKQQAEQFNAKMRQDMSIAVMKEQGANERAMLSAQGKNKSDGGQDNNSPNSGGVDSSGRTIPLSSAGMSVSNSEPIELKWGSNMEEVQDAVTKSYTKMQNIFEEGTWHGNQTISGELNAFKFVQDKNYLNGNVYYKDNAYLQAAKYALDEIYKKRPDLTKYIGMKPAQTDNEGWNGQKEIIRYIRDRVKNIISNPSNPEEHDFANSVQEAAANKIALTNFMERAKQSGDPIQFFKNNSSIITFPNARYDFDPAKGTDKNTRESIAQNLNNIHGSLESNINRNYQDELNAVGQIKNIPKEYISSAEIGENGKVQIYFKPEIFDAKITKIIGEDGEEKVPSEASGPFSQSNRFIFVYDPKAPNGHRRVSVDEIKQKGYLEYDEPRFNKVNMFAQLGVSVDSNPQTYWDSANDGTGKAHSVPFKIRKSTVHNKIEAQVGNGEWVNLNTSNAQEAINVVRQQIRSTSFENIR